VLRRDDQHAVGLLDLVLEARHFGRQRALVILIVHRQIVDADDLGVEFSCSELDQGLSKFAVDRLAAVSSRRSRQFGAWAWLRSSVRNRN